MKMTPRLDDGDVLLRRELEIGDDWNHGRLECELAALGGKLASQALDMCARGSVELTPQDHSEATYTSFHNRDDTIIDWRRPALEIYNAVRAWDPDIGALTFLPGGRRLKVWRVSYEIPEDLALDIMMEPPEPGSIVRATSKDIWVATADGALKLVEVQPENKQRMPVASFLAGNKLAQGMQLGGE
jgi:methionyl-tRNA formyltransferase